MAKLLWCWRCQMEIPMLEDGEAVHVFELMGKADQHVFEPMEAASVASRFVQRALKCARHAAPLSSRRSTRHSQRHSRVAGLNGAVPGVFYPLPFAPASPMRQTGAGRYEKAQRPFHKGGMPPFVPTELDRAVVQLLVSMGMPQHRLCRLIRGRNGKPISETTLKKYFAHELQPPGGRGPGKVPTCGWPGEARTGEAIQGWLGHRSNHEHGGLYGPGAEPVQ
jgi:hypothetical protein